MRRPTMTISRLTQLAASVAVLAATALAGGPSARLAAAAPDPAAAASPAALSSVSSTYVLDREAYSRTSDTRFVRTTYDLQNGPNLLALPFQIGDWTGEDVPITNEETFSTLNADQIVYRGYSRSDGQMIVLSLVGSTRGESFHHPLVCYERAGWETEDRGTTVI